MRRAMTWVYCEPKSRIRIFECFGGAAVFTLLGMRLGDAMLARWIAGLSLFGDDLALTSDPAFQLRLNVSTTSLFERIGAAARECRAPDHEQDRQGPHPLILGMKLAKANGRL